MFVQCAFGGLECQPLIPLTAEVLTQMIKVFNTTNKEPFGMLKLYWMELLEWKVNTIKIIFSNPIIFQDRTTSVEVVELLGRISNWIELNSYYAATAILISKQSRPYPRPDITNICIFNYTLFSLVHHQSNNIVLVRCFKHDRLPAGGCWPVWCHGLACSEDYTHLSYKDLMFVRMEECIFLMETRVVQMKI